jgi:hypothetical protein
VIRVASAALLLLSAASWAHEAVELAPGETAVEAGGRVIRSSQLSAWLPGGSQLDEEALLAAQPRELGVIVELRSPPAALLWKALSRQGRPVQESLRRYRVLLESEHEDVVRALRSRHPDVEVGHFWGVFNGIHARGVSREEALEALRGVLAVKRVHENLPVRASLETSVSQIRADQVWQKVGAQGMPLDGSGVTIGIVDTGVDYTHPDLGGCFGPGCKVAGGYDFIRGGPDPMDDNGHGTHVAATAAGNGAMGAPDGTYRRYLGVAPGATLYAYKVLSAAGNGSNAQVMMGVERCADPDGDGDFSDHHDVCSMSLGGSGNPDDAMSTSVDNAVSAGVVFTVAAGNRGPGEATVDSPGSARRAITVAASCKTEDVGHDPKCQKPIAQFSSRGPVRWTNGAGQAQTLAKPDVTAPGHLICAARWGSVAPDKACGDDAHIAISGTSMATPHVAGVAALILQARPELTPARVKDVLMSTADSLPGMTAADQGAGQVDAEAAIRALGAAIAPLEVVSGPLTVVDVPRTLKAEIPGKVRVRNRSGAPLRLTPRFTAASAGLQMGLPAQPVEIGAGQEAELPFQLRVDHAVLASGLLARGKLELSGAGGAYTLPLAVPVLPRIRLETAGPVDFGLDYAGAPAWGTGKSVRLVNSIADAAQGYRVAFRCCTPAGVTATPAGVQAASDVEAVTLPAAGKADVGLRLELENSSLPNGRYSGWLELTSPVQKLRVPVTFYKGYSLRLQTAVKPATFTLFRDVPGDGARDASISWIPDAAETTLNVSFAGPWLGSVFWWPKDVGVTGRFSGVHVLRRGILSDKPLVDVSVSPAEATVELKFDPKTHRGKDVFDGTIFYRLASRASGQGSALLSGGWGPGYGLLTSPLEAGFSFTASAWAKSDDKGLDAFLYQKAGPISTDLLFTNAGSEFVKKRFVSHQNRMAGQRVRLWGGACVGGTCAYTSGSRLDLDPSDSGTLHLHNEGPADITAPGVRHDYGFLNLVLSLPLANDVMTGTVSKSPDFTLSGGSIYAWYNAPAYWGKLQPRLDPFPKDVMVLGNAPIRDASRWKNAGNKKLELSSQHSTHLPLHLWAGGSDEWNNQFGQFSGDVAAHYVLRREGQVLLSDQVAYGFNGPPAVKPVDELGAAPPPGRYEFELTRPAYVAGVETRARSLSRFTLAAAAIDENPPALRNLHLSARGLWQNVVDPGTANELELEVDPVPGLTTAGSALPDGVASVALRMRADQGAWAEVPLEKLAGNRYRAALKPAGGAKRYGFEVVAKDLAGNSLEYSFELPKGKAIEVD